jgi:hypothetical protein
LLKRAHFEVRHLHIVRGKRPEPDWRDSDTIGSNQPCRRFS